MPEIPPKLREAFDELNAWLPPDRDAQAALGQRTSDQLYLRFMAIARLAGFSMCVALTDQGWIGRWTHPRLKGCELPDSGLTENPDDARIHACGALLKCPTAVQRLAEYRDRVANRLAAGTFERSDGSSTRPAD